MAVKGQKSGLDRTQNPERSATGGNGAAGKRPATPRPLGAIPVYDHPSAGQVASALGNAFSLGTGSVAGLLGGVASADSYGRSLLGRALDNLTGGVPEAPSRWAAPPSAPNLDGRAEKHRLLDQSPRDAEAGDGAAAAPDPTAAGTAEGAKDSPNVVLRDRRRGVPLYAGTELLARRS